MFSFALGIIDRHAEGHKFFVLIPRKTVRSQALQEWLEKVSPLLRASLHFLEQAGINSYEPDFANNQALIHPTTFGAVKEQTERGWSEHTYEEQYQEALSLVRQFLLRLRKQLQWRPKR